jgi:branched-chain amino acid transport system ATP-binding protein
MSGGEQQMLAIGRALMSEPDILLIDEPTEGLMPKHVNTIRNILTQLNEQGVTILLVEQNTKMALEISDYAYILEEGKIKKEGIAAELRNQPEVIEEFLSI